MTLNGSYRKVGYGEEFPDRTRLPVEPSDCMVYRIVHHPPRLGDGPS